MTPTEAVQLTGYIQAHFPSQPINEFTPDALGELLADYPMADCRAAVLSLSRRGDGDRTRWCSPSDVAAEVRRIRGKRIAEAGDLTPPRGLTDQQERDWLREARRAIGDGAPAEQVTRAAVGPARDIKELGQAGTSVDAALATKPLRQALRDAQIALQEAAAEQQREADAKRARHEQARQADRAVRETTEEVAS